MRQIDNILIGTSLQFKFGVSTFMLSAKEPSTVLTILRDGNRLQIEDYRYEQWASNHRVTDEELSMINEAIEKAQHEQDQVLQKLAQERIQRDAESAERERLQAIEDALEKQSTHHEIADTRGRLVSRPDGYFLQIPGRRYWDDEQDRVAISKKLYNLLKKEVGGEKIEFDDDGLEI